MAGFSYTYTDTNNSLPEGQYLTDSIELIRALEKDLAIQSDLLQKALDIIPQGDEYYELHHLVFKSKAKNKFHLGLTHQLKANANNEGDYHASTKLYKTKNT